MYVFDKYLFFRYVREIFDNCLPSESTLTTWCSKVDGTPGLSQQALHRLQQMAGQKQNLGQELDVCLMFDEMAIQSCMQFVGKKIYGGEDLGDRMEYKSDQFELAKDSLVFMVTPLCGSWKLPIGYFLTARLNATGNIIITSCL